MPETICFYGPEPPESTLSAFFAEFRTSFTRVAVADILSGCFPAIVVMRQDTHLSDAPGGGLYSPPLIAGVAKKARFVSFEWIEVSVQERKIKSLKQYEIGELEETLFSRKSSPEEFSHAFMTVSGDCEHRQFLERLVDELMSGQKKQKTECLVIAERQHSSETAKALEKIPESFRRSTLVETNFVTPGFLYKCIMQWKFIDSDRSDPGIKLENALIEPIPPKPSSRRGVAGITTPMFKSEQRSFTRKTVGQFKIDAYERFPSSDSSPQNKKRKTTRTPKARKLASRNDPGQRKLEQFSFDSHKTANSPLRDPQSRDHQSLDEAATVAQSWYASADSRRERLRRRVRELGLKVVDVSSKGDCFFDSVACGFSGGLDGDQIRRRVQEEFQEHPGLYTPFISSRDWQQLLGPDCEGLERPNAEDEVGAAQAWSLFVDCVGNKGFKAGEVCIAAAARALNCNIRVVTDDESSAVHVFRPDSLTGTGNEDNGLDTVSVGYCDRVHYVSLISKNGDDSDDTQPPPRRFSPPVSWEDEMYAKVPTRSRLLGLSAFTGTRVPSPPKNEKSPPKNEKSPPMQRMSDAGAYDNCEIDNIRRRSQEHISASLEQ